MLPHQSLRPPTLSLQLVFYDGSQALARVQGVDGLVRCLDAGEPVRDVVVDRQLAPHALVDQDRDILARLEAAERRALPDAPRHQLERSRRDLVARGGDADDAGGACAGAGRDERWRTSEAPQQRRRAGSRTYPSLGGRTRAPPA